jgi:hypothetical protein
MLLIYVVIFFFSSSASLFHWLQRFWTCLLI